MSADRTTRPKKTGAKKSKAPKPAPEDDVFAGLPPTAVDLDALPTPQLVLDMLAKHKPKKKDYRAVADEYKVSFYYGGMTLAARITPERYIIIAAGVPGEGKVRTALESIERKPGDRIFNLNPDPIEDYLDGLQMPHPPAAE